ncbi:MAG: hexose kinase [Ruminococcus sp.]|jgi:1-phosphofructokinase|nr:hexose kinase [Ruminococcus sp.]
MIYTVTVSPSLDYYMPLNKLSFGAVNRAENCRFEVGGKGLNIAKTLYALGVSNVCALGFTAGFVGDEIERQCRLMGITAKFTRLSSGCSRINTKISENADGFSMTEINAPAPEIDSAARADFLQNLNEISAGDILILSGSVPKNCDIYRVSAEIATAKGAELVVDCEGETLREMLEYKPYLIKPNQYELCALWNVPPTTDRAAIEPLVEKTLFYTENILLSLGDKGALLASKNAETLFAPAKNGTVINTVGAGDTLLAGFLYAQIIYSNHREKSLTFAVETAAERVFGKHIL